MTTEPTPTERPDWLAPLADPKSEMILRAAFDVFEEHGLHSATMLDVAKRAKVSKETLYARFDSKEGLFYALLAWGCRQSAMNLEEFAANENSDPVADLHAYARAMATSIMRKESLAVYRMAVGESGRNPELGRAFDEMSCNGTEDFLGRLAPRLAALGVIEPTEASELSETFVGLMRGNFHHSLLTTSRAEASTAELEAWADRAVRLLLRAYAPQQSAHAIAAE